MQDVETDLIIDLFPIRRKKKSSTAKNPKNGRLPKKPKTPSKIVLKKGVFLNSTGLADLAKHRFLADLVKEEQINFIALSETGRDVFPDHTLKNLCAGWDFLWHCMAPHG